MEALGPALGAAPCSPTQLRQSSPTPGTGGSEAAHGLGGTAYRWSSKTQAWPGNQGPWLPILALQEGLPAPLTGPMGGPWQGPRHLQACLCPAVLLTLSVKLAGRHVQVETHMPLTCTAFIIPGLQPLWLSCPLTLTHDIHMCTCLHAHTYT